MLVWAQKAAEAIRDKGARESEESERRSLGAFGSEDK